jgi:hypothetical protein
MKKNTRLIQINEDMGNMVTYTHNSANSKTGNMAQVSILPLLEKPTQALRHKTDDCICGICPLKGKYCYVNTVAYDSIYLAAIEQINCPLNRFPEPIKPVRFGAYGDPLLGFEWSFFDRWCNALSANNQKYTGYTHQWPEFDPIWSTHLMASIDAIQAQEYGFDCASWKQEANNLGYRTFRIIHSIDELLEDEILCPSPKVQCASCGLCSGNRVQAKNIAIVVHGAPNKIIGYNKLQLRKAA